MKTIEQQNAMIAEFMGCTFEYKKTDKAQVKVVNGLLNFIQDWRRKIGVATSGVPYLPIRDLKFHTSWDWLMPVVEKIAEICHKNDNEIYRKFYNNTRQELLIFRFTKEETFSLCIEFIEWYNANK